MPRFCAYFDTDYEFALNRVGAQYGGGTEIFCLQRPGMVRNIRHFFQRGEVTEQELRTLHGIVTELAIGRRERGRLEPDMMDETG